ncbi:MAG: chromosomal replication initiator protein DnaA [Clostridia bacterium]|nr:chromosomal replication initiator protein DnaA [Clostridia bacterium]
MQSFESLWEDVKKECQRNISEVIFDLWFKDLELYEFDIDSSVVILSTVEYKKKVIDAKFINILRDAFEKVFGFPVDVQVVSSTPKKESTPVESYSENTFETFVVGSSNKFAHAAAMAVANNPGKAYNPLFIYGHSGLGKTHLLNAICNEISKSDPSANIVSTKGETFTNELIEHLKYGKMDQFHEKYRSSDVLLVDDIQFIGGKETTQEEFFHTFNELNDAGKQIVLTSDRPPKEISRLDERLRTRFEWGLLADIQPPDIETRMIIIERKADSLGIKLKDDVVLYIAEKLKNNIRQLEGAVKRMKASIDLGSPANIATAQNAIKDILHDEQPPVITVEKVIAEVARTFNVSPDDIRSSRQDSTTSKCRQIAMYVIKETTGLSSGQIGDEFGGKDHSTVLYGVKKIKKEIERNSSLRNTVEDIIKNVREAQD